MFTVKINVFLKRSVLDPQGIAVKKNLENLDELSVEDVRIGKYIELKLKDSTKTKAEQTTVRLCEKLLVNQVIENYTFEIE